MPRRPDCAPRERLGACAGGSRSSQYEHEMMAALASVPTDLGQSSLLSKSKLVLVEVQHDGK